MRHDQRTRRLFAVIAAASFVFGACSSQGGASPTGAASAAPTTVAASDSAAASIKSGLTIGFSMPALAESFWISAAYGIDTAAKKVGATVIKANAGGDSNADQQISQIQDLIQRKVNAIIVGATNADAVKAVVEQAVAAGIPVVGISAIPNTDKIVSAVGADNLGMGKLQAECLGKAINGSGKVALLAGPPGQTWADLRLKGFVDAVKAEFSGIQLLQEDRTAVDRASGLNVMQALIQKEPALSGAYTAYDDIGAGAIDAIKAAAKGGQIKVSSSNLSQIGEGLLKAGDFVCETTQQVVLQGTDALMAAVTAASGGQPEKDIITSAIEVTKDNLASLDFSTIRAPDGYTP